MTTDAWLAIAHHVAVFGLAGVIAAEWALVRGTMTAADVRRLGRVDSVYGIAAMAVIVAGVARVIWGAKPADFYTESATFWFKMTAFGAMGLLSILPTIRYIGWRRAVEADPSAVPSDEAVGWARRMINLQLAVFVLIPVFAALMARGIGA
jgi:putative membrane protein